ncbi:hypothetical protein F7725_001787 [Dissostichus mawsoni]|uniref:Glycosyl transferase CAP10 domain-containing protein n=1 Tax=Dissostichus mawsoni TaxID=36200 RepID=A0A7J5Y3M7_DISMA|nr:hypothetical protein F7725_001787 [Dissostichus mawsoni]
MSLRIFSCLLLLFCLDIFRHEVLLGAQADSVLSAAQTLVWGPGLDTDVVLPARFFFIQAVDGSGTNLTTSPGEKTFEVKIESPAEQFTRIWIQVLDRHDGSFLVRYRMYATYTDLHINVLLKNKHVAKSPFILKGQVYHEGCDCPQTSGSVWEADMQCPQSFPQIERDLALYAVVDPDRNADEIPKRFGQRQSLCHYTIKDNKVYVQTYGEHVGFRIFMDSILLSITRKVRLPDLEFFVNLGDWPLEKRKPSERIHPIFSWCGSNNTRDIANTGPPWPEKNSTAFWRGRDSRQERLELVKLSRAHPDSINAAFTNFFFFKHDESLYGPLVKHVSFFDFFKYKYQINIDGTVAAYRLPYLLAGNSVVLKQDSGYYEHFYYGLRPWEHYIPVRADMGDLLEKIQWARDHDEEAKNIGLAGQQFARTNLMGNSIFCYYYQLYQGYANLQVTEPKVREGMELVEQPSDDLFPCSCHRTRVRDSETVKVPFGTKHLDTALCFPSSVTDVHTAVILTHGAGGDMNFKHLVSLAHALASDGFLCIRFTCKGLNLGYRVKAYRAVLDYLKSQQKFAMKHIFVGGRSMGCRAAAALARQLSDESEDAVQGVICLSFPLHPPGQKHVISNGAKISEAFLNTCLCCVCPALRTTCVLFEGMVKEMKAQVEGFLAERRQPWTDSEGKAGGVCVRGIECDWLVDFRIFSPVKHGRRTVEQDASVKSLLVENGKLLQLLRSEILQTEVRVLYELLYILNNSYRGNKTFKGLKQVEQCINRLKNMKLDVALQELTELCPNRIQRGLSITAGVCELPSQPMLEWLCLKVLGAAKLMSCTLNRCSRTFSYPFQRKSNLDLNGIDSHTNA